MFKKILDWTRVHRARLGETGITFVLIWLWLMVILTVASLLAAMDVIEQNPYFKIGEALLPTGMNQTVATGSIGAAYFWLFLTGVIFAPLVEEMFRAGLCQICTGPDGKPRYLFALLSGSFLLFGLLHGMGYLSVLLQGALGLLLTRLWFKTGPSRTWSYFANVFVHAAYNFSVLTIEVLAVSLLT